MEQLQELLAKAGAEMLAWKANPSSGQHRALWLDRLSERMFAASKLPQAAAMREAHAIAHSLLDSGPDYNEAAPSFGSVLLLLQHRGRKP